MYLFGNQENYPEMGTDYFDLPELITLEEFGGNFDLFLEAVYEIFKKDFVEKKLTFRGTRLGLKKIPYYKEKEATFWHMTSEGEDEDNRIPDLRRIECIRWPNPLIVNSEHPYLKVWPNQRKGEDRILIFHENESYLVVLADRGGYILPWTTYYIEKKHTKHKLLKEYEAYKNANAAQ